MIEIKHLTKIYRPKKGPPVVALNDVSLKIEKKGMVFILGKSGSGKSTLMNTLGGLDSYDAGEIFIKGRSSRKFSQKDFDSYRNTYVGFIFQDYNILEEFTVGENIALAMQLRGEKLSDDALEHILSLVDLKGQQNRHANELSGGQKQRVAIARALVKDPEIILADEPTGALDSHTGEQVLDTLKKLSEEKLVIVVSHDREFAERYGDRIIEMSDGKIIADVTKEKHAPAKIGKGIRLIGDKIIRVDKGYAPSDEELKTIGAFLKDSSSERVISLDENANIQMKAAAGADEEGNTESFAKTKQEALSVNTYAYGDFQPIASKLPFFKAFKMGASALKSKPFRLFLTILLSAIAFCLFGLSDAVASFDRAEATAASIREGGITYAAFTKASKIYYEDGDYWWYSSGLLLDEDIEAINETFGDHFCVPVYSRAMPLRDLQDSSLITKDGYNYFTGSMKGLAEVDEDDIKSLGFTVTGTLPQSTDEVALTTYMYEHFETAGYCNPENDEEVYEIGRELDLIGKKIELSMPNGTSRFTVTAIIDTNLDEKKYEQFRPDAETTDATVSDYLTYNEFVYSLTYGPHAICYVCDGFLEANGFDIAKDYAVNQGYSVDATYSVTDSSGYTYTQYFLKSIYDLADVTDETVVFFNGADESSLGRNDILLDLPTAIDLYNGKLPSGQSEISLSDGVYRAAYDFALQTYEDDPDSLASFIADRMTDESKITAETVAQNYGEYYRLKFSGFNYVKEYLQTLSAFVAQAVDEAIETLSSAVLQNPVLHATGIEDGESVSRQKTLTVRGVVYDATATTAKGFYKTGTAYFTAEGIADIGVKLARNGTYAFALGTMPSSYADILKIVTYSLDESLDTRYKLNNSVTSSITEAAVILEMLTGVFFYIGLACALFASVLMMNFIGTSISYKKREIGILRAVGARGLDVFSIFFSESAIIALINWAAALTGTLVVASVINAILKNMLALNISLLNAGIRQAGLILLISLAVAALASFFPVRNIARKKPIDAIQNK